MALGLGLTPGLPGRAQPGDCDAVGAYRAADGQILVLSPATGRTLRFRLADGRTGRLYRRAYDAYAGGPGWAAARPRTNRLSLEGCAGTAVLELGEERIRAERIPLQIDSVPLPTHDGRSLAGRLVLPPDDPTAPVAVLSHRDGTASLLSYDYWQYMLPALGVGVFVHDKRGTGASEGQVSEDFDLLAQDLLAAYAAAVRRVGQAPRSIGLMGMGASGGHSALIAADRAQVDFLVMVNGRAGTPAMSDEEEVLYELAALGFDAAVLDQAKEVTAATRQVVTSKFSKGFDALDTVRRRYGDTEWIGHVRGDYSRKILKAPTLLLRTVGPVRAPDLRWDFDPRQIIAGLNVRQLWVLAGEDSETPSASTLAFLDGLREEQRHDLSVLLLKGAEHDNVLFNITDQGRVRTRYAPGYFRNVARWVRGEAMRPGPGALVQSGTSPETGS